MIQGHDVRHIVDIRNQGKHKLNEIARIKGRIFTYPTEEPQLPFDSTS